LVLNGFSYRPLKPLPNNLSLEAHYSKIIQNKPKAVCGNDFEMMKVIGKGGFSKVYMGTIIIVFTIIYMALVRKKDTGFLYAMKVMKKSYVTNDSKLKQIMNERTIMEQLG
jgi:serine/threonine protein kinase